MRYGGSLSDHSINNLGEVTYTGEARGIRSDGDTTSVFDGEVTLTAEFRDALISDDIVGTIEGSIQIDDSELTLGEANISEDGAGGFFEGETSMGSLNGRWGGKFYGPEDIAGPGSAAGTFGATGDGEDLLGIFATYRNEN